jgi:hypothetical protein
MRITEMSFEEFEHQIYEDVKNAPTVSPNRCVGKDGLEIPCEELAICKSKSSTDFWYTRGTCTSTASNLHQAYPLNLASQRMREEYFESHPEQLTKKLERAKWQEEHPEEADRERKAHLEELFLELKERILQQKEQMGMKKEEIAEL